MLDIKNSNSFNNHETTIEDVLEFISKHGDEYDYDIQKALDSKSHGSVIIEEVVSDRRGRYWI